MTSSMYWINSLFRKDRELLVVIYGKVHNYLSMYGSILLAHTVTKHTQTTHIIIIIIIHRITIFNFLTAQQAHCAGKPGIPCHTKHYKLNYVVWYAKFIPRHTWCIKHKNCEHTLFAYFIFTSVWLFSFKGHMYKFSFWFFSFEIASYAPIPWIFLFFVVLFKLAYDTHFFNFLPRFLYQFFTILD